MALKGLPKILRRDARLLKVENGKLFNLHYEDIRPTIGVSKW